MGGGQNSIITHDTDENILNASSSASRLSETTIEQMRRQVMYQREKVEDER